VFDIKPAVLYCLTCEQEFPARAFQSTCPGCGGKDVLLTGGIEELQLVEMEVD
jgi:Zn finger protein HypA/HybF involved in hydrogenase expression